MLVIIFSSFVILVSILVDIFFSSFMRFLRFCDDAFDFNRFPKLNYRLIDNIS